MRWDMFKVIVERPRGGGGYPRRRGRVEERARLDPEQAPLQQANGRGRGSKHLRENLAPLRRYLLGQVGRPWDAVHAEISAHLRLTSAVQRHVLEHLEQMVVRHAALVEGRPVFVPDHRPVIAGRWRAVVYVCPRTGRLRAAPRRQRTPTPPPQGRVDLPDGSQLQRLAGVWYHVRLMPVPARYEDRLCITDVVLRRRIGAPDLRALQRELAALYGRVGVYAADKQQLGKRALARLLPEDLR